MASRTIRIDLVAYRRLSRARRTGESFSDVNKRVIPKPFDISKWLNAVRKGGISDQTAELIETHVRTRRRRARCHRYFEIQFVLLVLGISTSLRAQPTSSQPESKDSVSAAVQSLRNMEAKPVTDEERTKAAIHVDTAWKTIMRSGLAGRRALKAEMEKVIANRIDDSFFRLNSASLLWEMGGLTETNLIARILNDSPLHPHYHYAFRVAIGAAKTQDPRAIPILKAVLHDDKGTYFVQVHQMPLHWSENIEFIWGTFGSKGLAALHEVLKQSHDDVELKSAAVLLGQAQYMEALPDLRTLAHSGSGAARNYAIEWLGELGHPTDFEFLKDGLTSTDQGQLEAYIRGCMQFEDLRTVPALIPLLKAQSPSVRSLAIDALACLVTPESIHALHDHADSTQTPTEKSFCSRFVSGVLGDTSWEVFSSLDPKEQAEFLRKRDGREGGFRVQPGDRRITRHELLRALKEWKKKHRVTDKKITAGPMLAVLEPGDLPLLIDVRAAIYSRLSDECLYEVAFLNTIIRRLGRGRYRREVGICERVELPSPVPATQPTP